MESGYDGGVLELSADGVSWQDATTFGAFLQNGYNDTLSTGYSNPIGGRSAWSGDSSTYVETVLELSQMPGNQIWLRFRLGADSGVSDQGWWIDDIRIDGTASCAPPEVFADGFESGDTTAWSDGMP